MIILGNVPVLTSIYQILITLRRELHMEGISLLKDINEQKYNGQDIMITCPFHKYGQENKPSCGVTTTELKQGNKIISAGVFHCFSCHAHGDITELISHCFGKKDGGIFGKKWILERFNNYEVENREGFFHKINLTKEQKDIKYITDDELNKYRFYHPYMYKRGLTDDIIDFFDIGYDKEFKLREGLKPFGCVTFPIKDENGNVLFIARRGIKTKFFHYPNLVDKPIVYLYEVQKLYPDSKVLWIVESIFNALTLYRWGCPSVALLGTGSKTQIDKLKILPYRKYIICSDGDEAGDRAFHKLYEALHKYKLIERVEMVCNKDVNDFKYCNDYDEFLRELKKERGN